MTRSDLVARLAERFGQLTQRDTEFAVKTILDAMTEALVRWQCIEIRGLCRLLIHRRPPPLGRQPRRSAYVVPPHDAVPHFQPRHPMHHTAAQPAPGRPVYAMR